MDLKNKIIALDIDGTIAADGKEPSSYTCDTIKSLLKQGYNIVLVTGRGYATVKDIYKNCGMNGFCVTFNGAKVFNPTTNEIILDIKFPKNYLFDLINKEKILELVDDIMIEQDENVYSLKGMHPWIKESIIGDFPIKLNDNIYCVNTVSINRDNHQKVKNIVRKNKNYDYRYWYHLGEIYCLNYTKKDGAEALLKHFNKTFDDLIFIGDSDNDIEILSSAKVGVAMKNATDKAKNSADIITEYNVEEDGAIRHLLKMIEEK